MVVVVAVAVVGVTEVGIIVVDGPDASNLSARPLLLACMPCNFISFVCPAILPRTRTTETFKDGPPAGSHITHGRGTLQQ